MAMMLQIGSLSADITTSPRPSRYDFRIEIFTDVTCSNLIFILHAEKERNK